ncbi:LOW QUALITY PROTEIN: endoglin [Apteryx mantelli]|uniref:LOW QUALITY PROTEIN: endoglin n=1 Tax=Apteryx mantelli TaxID=2696672 RepID=A0ABM4FJ88_9AVES
MGAPRRRVPPPPPLLPLLLLPALLCCAPGRADPGRATGCDLQPVTAEPLVTLSYATGTVPRGCVSSSSLKTAQEVHILSVTAAKASAFTLNVSVVPRAGGCTRRAVLVLHCARCSATVTSPCPNLLIRTNANLNPAANASSLGPELPEDAGEQELLRWAWGTYGGVTSYSELQDPRWVLLRLGEDSGSPEECVPQERFNATQHLETEVFFRGVKGCSSGTAESTRAAHIVRLQPERSSAITEVNLSLSCAEVAVSNQILILQSQANLTWSLSVNNCHIQFLVSGTYKIAAMSTELLKGEVLPDTEQGLIAKAFEKNYRVIASYSTIPVSTRVTLEIQEHEVAQEPPATPTPTSPPSDMLSHTLLLMLQPWKCTDDTMEIVIARSHLEPIKDVVNITLRDISCQAEKNATHFMLRTPLSHCGTSLESKGHAKNELILSLSKGSSLRSVPVPFQCKIPRELFLRLFPTAAFEAPQTELEVNKEAYLQASVRWEDYPADLQLKECWLAAPGAEPLLLVLANKAQGSGVAALDGSPSSRVRKVWRFRFTYAVPEGARAPFSASLTCKAGLQNNTIFEKVLEVTVKDVWRPPNNRGLGLAAVLGITFGAFLIGALLTAGLWYIYSHTRPISKMQPVSTTAPASESSSTNHSIGSTQSTPCSTSSMA